MWKLSSRAFQWCITLYSRKWTVWPWEAIFCKKLPEKQLFWRTRNRINWLWPAITPVQNLEISKTTTFSESPGRQLSDELLGRPLASILSERRAVTLLRGGGHRNLQKNDFFASFASPRKFCEENFYQDRTMWKSTDSAFRICVTHGGQNDYWPSYYCSKSGDGGKSEFVPEIMRCYKKKTRPQFSKFWLHIESAWNYMGFFHADSIWSINFENCGRVFFFQHLISV